MDTKTVVLSGIRATGRMHLGNYLGAIRQYVTLGENPDYECYYFVADLHSLTTMQDAQDLQRNIREIVTDFLALGLDPIRHTIYTQSSVPEICELNWLLACLTPVQDLMTMPHFKEKRAQIEGAGLDVNGGLLTYPVLMAADILAPCSNLIPVGEDQLPHIELTRSIARRFNARFGQLFPIPESLQLGSGIRVPSLGGSGKMSKSDEGAQDTIFMIDEPDVVDRKFRSGMTDPARQRRTDPGTPEKCPIYTFHQLLSTPEELAHVSQGCRSAGIGCLECKQIVANHVKEILQPFQKRRQEIQGRGPQYIDEVLHEGGRKARARIAPTVAKVKELMGVPTF